MRPVGETEFVAGVAAMSDSGNYGPTRVAAGIVGYADLTLGDQVEPILLAHLRAGGGRFRGVRHSAGWDESPIIGNSRFDTRPHLYQRPDFRAGLKRLSALGLSFDAWLYHPQLTDVVDLARAVPATPIIMGHVGGLLGYGPYAGRRDEVFADWKGSMAELATCPNVVVKLGGMVNRGAGYDFHSAPVPPSSETIAEVWRPISRPASSCSDRPAACSRAISRWTKWRSATRRCGTPSSASLPAPRATKSSRCSPAPRPAPT